jgi:ring-1,2-phenylacetyl-CoA epoxidase subunit PaaC
MKTELSQALRQTLLALADDELILAHRNSEWTGHGPILEEDIAFSNIAQDELGHATLWYGILQQLTGENSDELVFAREAAAWRNVQMVELPKGDWAFSMLRQYLFDMSEVVRLAYLVNSSYQPLADAAAKIRREEIYHLRHTQGWVKRLGLGTDESHRRMQRALETMWPYAQQLRQPPAGEALLVEAGFTMATNAVHHEWQERVRVHLTESGLNIPEKHEPPCSDRSAHTPHLDGLLEEMQTVARLDPEAEW